MTSEQMIVFVATTKGQLLLSILTKIPKDSYNIFQAHRLVDDSMVVVDTSCGGPLWRFMYQASTIDQIHTGKGTLLTERNPWEVHRTQHQRKNFHRDVTRRGEVPGFGAVNHQRRPRGRGCLRESWHTESTCWCQDMKLWYLLGFASAKGLVSSCHGA